MRLRLTFSKNTAMRYTGHLDVQRALERAFRRACLPLAYSQGFSPHARINLAAPLPLGFTSEGEVADFWLDEAMPVADVQDRLATALPPGLDLISLEQVQDNEPSLQSRVTAAQYRIISAELTSEIIPKINRMLDEEHIMRVRRQKEYDLRPLIQSISTLFPEDEPSRAGIPGESIHKSAQLVMCLSVAGGKTGRPEEVLDALQITPHKAHIHRTMLVF